MSLKTTEQEGQGVCNVEWTTESAGELGCVDLGLDWLKCFGRALFAALRQLHQVLKVPKCAWSKDPFTLEKMGKQTR